MLIALTGATGFIGQYLLQEMPKHGHRVRALLRRPASMPVGASSAVIGDLTRPQNMSAALEGVALRAVLIYGPEVKGNMAQLIKLARSPLPLPLASLTARRSLLALENLSAAIETVLAAPGTLRRAVVAADPQALTIAEMIAALRSGLGRPPNAFPFPPAGLQLLFRAAGQYG